jgi:hypothetical protein
MSAENKPADTRTPVSNSVQMDEAAASTAPLINQDRLWDRLTELGAIGA